MQKRYLECQSMEVKRHEVNVYPSNPPSPAIRTLTLNTVWIDRLKTILIPLQLHENLANKLSTYVLCRLHQGSPRRFPLAYVVQEAAYSPRLASQINGSASD